MNNSNCHRLTKNVVPVNYKISLKPDLENWKFRGSETVDLKILEDQCQIVLNSAEIDIQSAVYNGEKAIISFDKEMERVSLSFPSTVKAGEGRLEIEFTGILNDNMKGFYRSTYLNDDGSEVRMAVTHFEASDARRAFPCWDEPCFRATFEISLELADNKVALSNMPVKTQTECKDTKTIKYEFEPTPKMSTYIVAFVVGELDFVESFDKNGLRIRVYTPKSKSHRGKFALDVSCKAVPFYTDYFGIGYPLPKMDLIAIPDFAIGAMENWGLLTYRETRLLIDETESSASSRQIVALVVGHEIAHMWFGNLVTMDWWTDLWLKEGFATWIEYLCVDHCYPEFDIWTEFAFSEYSTAIKLDSLKSSHPIEVVVEKPSEITEIFDAISYSKGAAIIRMLNDFLTNDVFKTGLNIYLKRHQYSNATTADLWSALEEASNQPVAQIMDTWTKQMGLPVITVDSVYDEDGSTVGVQLQQTRYLAAHCDGDKDEDKAPQYWRIPVTVCSIDNSDEIHAKFVMESHGQRQQFSLDKPLAANQYIRINPNAFGYYHTRYKGPNYLKQLTQCITDNKLTARDRLSLVMDQFALAKSANIETRKVLQFTLCFTNEINFTVWNILLANIGQITAIVEEMDPSVGDNIHRFYHTFLANIFNRLGWNSCSDAENHGEKMLRCRVIDLLGKCGYNPVVDEARHRFQQHCQCDEATKVIEADIRPAVYATVLRHGDEQTLNKMMDLLQRTDLHEERMRILGCLGAVPYELLTKVHEMALSDVVRKQDRYRVLLSTVRDSRSRRLFWEFVKTNWKEICDRISNFHMIGIVIKIAFQNFVTESNYKEIEEFFADKKEPFKRNLEQALESIRNNISLLKRDGKHLVEFFYDY